MKKTISIPTQIAAFFFLMGGMFNFVLTAGRLFVSIVTGTASVSSFQLAQIITIISAGLSILVGWYLVQQKHWAHILGNILVILSICFQIFFFAQYGITELRLLVISLLVLVLLVVGRKDFKQ